MKRSQSPGFSRAQFEAERAEHTRVAEALRRELAYFSQAQRASRTGAFVWQPSTGEITWSEETFRTYELDPETRPTLDRILERTHPDDRARLVDVIERSTRDGEDVEVEHRIVMEDGRVKHLRVVGHPSRRGDRLEYVGAVIDVTESKHAHEVLQRTTTYLLQAQALTKTGCWAIGRDRRLLYWSAEMYRMYGFDPKAGLPSLEQVRARVHPVDRLAVEERDIRAARDRVEVDAEFRIVLPDGTVRNIHGRAHPVMGPDGEVSELIGTNVDITERKRAEEDGARLTQLEANLAHVNRVSLLGELAASLAHELRQPIAATIMNAQAARRFLTREQPDTGRALQAMDRVVEDGTRAGEFITRLRSLYKKTAPGEHEPVDVNAVVLEMIELLRGEADRYGILMRGQLAPELPTVRADRVQLQQVFLNLMVNGIQAMKESRGELTIRTELAGAGELHISISDTGVGLPGNPDRIFEAFFTTKPQGSGMGLTISRSILESHGGRLWATSNEGKGATFHFSLSLAGSVEALQAR